MWLSLMEVHGRGSCIGGGGVVFDTWNIYTSPYLQKEKKLKEQTENMTLDASAKVLAKHEGDSTQQSLEQSFRSWNQTLVAKHCSHDNTGNL